MGRKLEVDGVLFEIGERRILSDIYCACDTGMITGILGRNGQGKTCLMKIICGSLSALNKSVRIDGVPLMGERMRLGRIAYLPQKRFIPRHLTIKRIFQDYQLNFQHLIEFFPEYNGKYLIKFKQLSGGQQRLLEVYVVILSPAEFVILDEPFSHISPLQMEIVKQLMTQEKEKKGFIISDHMYHHIMDISDRLYYLVDGKTHLIRQEDELRELGYIS